MVMRIRDEQVGALSPVEQRSLRDRVLGHVRAELGPGALPPVASDAARMIDAALAEARDMGLSWETQIADYAVLRTALGEGALARLGYTHNAQAPKAEIAAAFAAFLDSLPRPIHAAAPRR
ncbi:hypothetical protein ACQ5SO_07350 [Rhodovulum sp. DZ06]|uniref:hypothetical protein n=1 Tax=Rhodovulum sp. DZ06 TaxID=3425126 RepID=UPI003D35440F